MTFHFNSYATVLMMSGIAALLVSLVLFQRKRTAIFWFALMMMASAVWALAYALELTTSTLHAMLTWINVEYFGIGFIPALWIMFVIHFIGKKEWLTLSRVCLIFLFPILVVLFVWTNDSHHIHYINTSVDTTGPFPLLHIEPGPWYWIHTVYFYFLMAFGMFLLARYSKRSNKLYQNQTMIILVGAFVPWITNFFYLLGIRPHAHIDLTPYAFILTSLIIALGLMRYRLFDIVPFAREKLLENLREGMLVLDDQGRIIDYNPVIQKFLQNYSTKLVGAKLQEILPTQFAIHHLLLKDGNSRIEVRLEGDTTGPVHEYEVSATALKDDQQQRIGTLLVFWDITRRKQTTELLQHQAKELKELNDLKNRMFSIIAHDLKSPMAGLINILQLAQSDAFTEQELKGILQMVSKNVDNTRMLLDNLLYWAKSQLEGETIQAEQFPLKKIVDNNVALFEKRIAEKGIVFKDKTPEGLSLFADKNMIDLVLRNLVANAIKFCDKDDVITLNAEPHDGLVTVSVTDTGRGMDDQTKSKLFVLSAGGGVGTRNEKGTGLGLKLCKDFVEKNGGLIGAHSELGKGSMFHFTLPAHS